MNNLEKETSHCNRRWSCAVVVSKICQVQEAGHPLYSHYMRQNHQELLAAAVRYFGSWRKAVEASGFDYDAIRRYKNWTQEEIVQTIQKLHMDGADLSFRSMMLSDFAPMVYAAIRPNHFGTWKNALTASGLAVEEIYRYKSWENKNVIEEIKRLSDQGADLSSKNMDESENPLIATARRRFGSWGAAVHKAGLDYEQIRLRRRWTKELIIKGIREYHRRGITSSTEVRVRNPALFAAACKKRFFGGWLRAVRSAKIGAAATKAGIAS